MNLININVDNRGVCTIKYDSKNNMSEVKKCSVESLKEMFNAEKKISTPLLPFGCRKYEIKENGRHVVLMEIPPGIRHVKYIRRDRDVIFEGDVPFPPTLMMHILRNSNGKFKVEQSRIFALKNPLMTLNDQLYHFPTPNIFDDHKICWGGASELFDFDSIGQLGRTVDLFFSANYNTDIHPRMNLFERIEDSWKVTQKDKIFNYDVLVPAKHKIQHFIDMV